ncbi:SDR family NAD(P)-dependent oxidoreductase [Neisseriaceae bacterium PsAf]|nr:SDR family NAD(P)-dependent oxidoreductase [Neisseriaceae bacterium PsAf]
MAILVTGASAGFGKEMCKVFVNAGYQVIATARRLEKLEQLHQELGEKLLPVQMDVTDKKSVDDALNSLSGDWARIDLLINNAGLALGLESADKTDFSDWEKMIQTNVLGLTYVTHKILPQMVARKEGHIINLGSTAGSYPYYGANVYGASKAFVKQFSKNLRADLAKDNIRVSNIEPGLCGETEFSQVRFKGDEKKAQEPYAKVQYIKPEDIANVALWIYQQPAYLNINSIEIMPVAQTFAGLKVYKNENEA